MEQKDLHATVRFVLNFIFGIGFHLSSICKSIDEGVRADLSTAVIEKSIIKTSQVS
jgi:hypothetical protein